MNEKKQSTPDQQENRTRAVSLRTKLLISIISITGLSLLVYGAIFFYRTQQSLVFWSNTLQSTVQQQSQQQVTDSTQSVARTVDQTLSEITLSVKQLADYRTSLFTQMPYLGQGGYWDANSRLIKKADGQYANAISEPASVFIPSTESLSPELIADLNDSMFLDFSAPGVLRQNSNISAIYYVSEENYTVYYPNINLGSAVPADFDARTQSFYSVATPKNNPERKPVWTQPYQDPAGTGLIVTTSVPVYDKYGKFRGVMSADVQLSKISEDILTAKAGKTGFSFLIDPAGHIISMPKAGYDLFGIAPELVPMGETPKTTIMGFGSADFQGITRKMAGGESGLATATFNNTQYYVAYAPLPVIGYSLGLIAPASELDATYLAARETIQQEIQGTARLSILILLVMLAVASGISLILGRIISTPLTRLTETATLVGQGHLNVKAEVQTNDEIGILASTFNTMTSRLQDILGNLEQRVADRTRNLELAAEVGRAVSQVRELDIMLKDACNLILKEFGLYYVQVYLTDSSQTQLKLEAGTGNVGVQLVERGHSLPLNTSSINGRATIEKRSIVISDTTQSATFRQNPLLPDTRSEMAVPLIVANKVVGVLDMQSSKPGALTQEMLPAFEALAGQLAITIQNAYLLAETEQARAEVEKQARRLVRTNWSEHLDAIHKPEHIGFVFDHNQVVPLMDVEISPAPESEKTVSASISMTGESLGSLVMEIDDESQREQASELVSMVARQVAQQIENLRLLESAERFRYEAEQASRRLTHEGWQEYLETHTTKSSGFIYDLNEVRPYRQDEVEQIEESALSLPLKVRDEAIGKLVVKDVEDEDAVGMVSAVAERLSQHIEGLRLSMQTEQALASTRKQAQREQALRQITSAVRSSTDPATILRSAARELGNLLGRQTIVHMATAAEVKTGQADHPTEVEGEAVANNGNESVSSADRS